MCHKLRSMWSLLAVGSNHRLRRPPRAAGVKAQLVRLPLAEALALALVPVLVLVLVQVPLAYFRKCTWK